MVFVLVGIDNSVEAGDVFAKHLLPEIRARIDDYAFPLDLEMYGCP